jgi:4-hydroxy-tetrahydrodipicolinate synthase
MIEAAKRHTEPGLTIAATGDWSTEDAVEFARFAESCGADALQVLLPRRAADDEDAAFQHFQAVASSTRLPLVLHGKFSESLLRRLVQIDQIRAMKEDHLLEDLIRQQVDFGQRLVIFGGGAENRFLVGRPYGMRAYYSTYSTFAPDIAIQFWNAIRGGDEPQAVKITLKHDYPFIRRFSHPFWHATLEYFGIGTRHIRPPYKTFTDEQMQEVKAFFDAQGLGPQRYLD